MTSDNRHQYASRGARALCAYPLVLHLRLRTEREELRVRRPCGWCGSPAPQRGLWRGWRGSKLQKLKNIFQTLVIIIHSVSCAIFRAFLFCTLLQSFTVFCTLLQSADMAKINVVTSQQKRGKPLPRLSRERSLQTSRELQHSNSKARQNEAMR